VDLNDTSVFFWQDGSKAVVKGNPSSSHNMHLKSQNVTRGRVKKIAWDHPRLPSTKDKILELLRGFVDQFLSGAYNGMIFHNMVKYI
jgi:timeless